MRTSEHQAEIATATKTFDRVANSVPEARHWAGKVYAEAGVDECLVEVCELLVSEVVTNAVRHGAGSKCTVSVLPDLWVEVWDDSPMLPRRRVVDSDSEGGRGLEFLEMLAPGYQVLHDATSGGKAVRFLPKGW
ncbi:ATP-binding protein [Streptomyces kronopolitis]